VIPDNGEIVEIIFTSKHADYWLSQAGPAADGTDTMKDAFGSSSGDDLGASGSAS
jgi:hypothetical protein